MKKENKKKKKFFKLKTPRRKKSIDQHSIFRNCASNIYIYIYIYKELYIHKKKFVSIIMITIYNFSLLLVLFM